MTYVCNMREYSSTSETKGTTHHLLILELLRDVTRPASGNFDPGLGKDGARSNGERDVNQRVHGVEEHGAERVWGRHVVRDTRHGRELRRVLEGLGHTTQYDATVGKRRKYRTSHTPRRRTRKLLGKRLASIWEMRKTFDVRALSNMIGMLDV